MFTDKTVLITGAAEGIGKAIAINLKAAGARVMINDIDGDKLAATGREHGLETVTANAGTMEGIETMLDAVKNTYGRLDFLIANAAVTRFAPFLEATEADFDAVADLNLKGTYFLTQRAARYMIDEKIAGRILLISSNVSKRVYPNLTAYSATKAAINMLARTLSVELGVHNIRINALAPGPTLTERTKLELDDYAGVWAEILPTKDVVRPEDIAATARFLLSEGARQITGETIMVDGGWSGLSVTPSYD